MRVMLVFWLLVAAAPAMCRAQSDELTLSLSARVAQLVLELDDNQRTRRQEAEEALIGLGPEALEFFPPITARTAAEVAERLGRVRKALEQQMAAAAAQPRRVTMRGEFSVAEALSQLEQQTGNRLVGYQARQGNVDVAFQDTPFWEALDELLDQSGLRVDPYGGEMDALVLASRPPEEVNRRGVADYEGIFRIEPIRLEARNDLRNPSINGLRLTISVAWEPRVRPISLEQPLDQIQAVDDRGRALVIDTQPRRGRLTATTETGVSGVEMIIPLELPQRASARIASFKGVLRAVVPGSKASFEFGDLASARDVEQEQAGVTVILERVRRNVDLHEVRVRVRFDEAGGALQSHHGWVFNNEAFLLDAEGHRVDNVGLQTLRQDASEVGVAYLFPLPQGLQGYTFVYATPATILNLPIPYELQDIQLP